MRSHPLEASLRSVQNRILDTGWTCLGIGLLGYRRSLCGVRMGTCVEEGWRRFSRQDEGTGWRRRSSFHPPVWVLLLLDTCHRRWSQSGVNGLLAYGKPRLSVGACVFCLHVSICSLVRLGDHCGSSRVKMVLRPIQSKLCAGPKNWVVTRNEK